MIKSEIDIEKKIKNGLSDILEGKLLLSYKEIEIRGTQNGKELDLYNYLMFLKF